MVVTRFFGAALLLVLAGCSPAGLLNATIPAGGVSVSGTSPTRRARGTASTSIAPNTRAARWWSSCTAAAGRAATRACTRSCPAARAAGAVVVVPDYRVYPDVQFPAFLEDNAAAVAWAVQHAAALGADPRKVFVVGHSAGAFDAAMLALDPRYLLQAGISRDRLAGVIGLAGPYDFLPSTDPDVIPVFGSANTPANQPVAFVDGRNPPMLLMAGEADTTVMPRNTVSLARRIETAHGLVESKLYPGVAHIGIVIAFAPLFSGKAPVLDDVWSFNPAAHAAGRWIVSGRRPGWAGPWRCRGRRRE